MSFIKRLIRLEKKCPPSPWVPPIIFHTVVEPSEYGLREIGAFAKLFLDQQNTIIWRSDDESFNNFKIRVMALKRTDF
jgi:hypothetical protein